MLRSSGMIICHLLGAQNSNSTFIEAVWILLGGNIKIDSEDEVRPGEVQVHGQRHLQRDVKLTVSVVHPEPRQDLTQTVTL